MLINVNTFIFLANIESRDENFFKNYLLECNIRKYCPLLELEITRTVIYLS